MAKKTSKSQSFQAIVTDLESLLTELRALRSNPQVISFAGDLWNAVDKLRALKARQLARHTAGRLATQQFKKAMDEGRYTASRIRSYLRGCLGHRNQELVRFGVNPSGKRRSRTAPEPDPDTDVN